MSKGELRKGGGERWSIWPEGWRESLEWGGSWDQIAAAAWLMNGEDERGGGRRRRERAGGAGWAAEGGAEEKRLYILFLERLLRVGGCVPSSELKEQQSLLKTEG